MSIKAFTIFVIAISKQIMAYSEGPGCGALLTDDIIKRTIEVSGSFNSSVDESHVLLNSSNAWCSGVLNTFQYLRIFFDKPATISGFEIQGRSSSNQYLKQFKVGYIANNNSNLQYYQTQSNPEIFQMTPSSGDEIIRFQINETQMKMVIFYPSQWNERICMRVELYGCVPVDGVYTPWSEWSYCSNSCGNGTKVRYRTCSNPAPANNGQDCTGDQIQTEGCIGMSCPVDGGFSEWSNWTTCSATCGTGFQLRTRSCTNPLPEHGGRSCEGKSAEGRKCKLRDCQGPGCGALLTDDIIKRTIEVSGSFNSSVDESHVLLNSSNAWCSGVLNTFQYLRIFLDKPATISGFEIQGRSSSNQYLTQFKVGYIANSNSNLQYYPTQSSPEIFQMTPSSGDEIIRFQINETQMKMVIFYPSQWNERICMRVELYGCVPVDGVYTPWSEWSYCSNSCGNGTKVRYRTCSNPAPANNGQDCTGDQIQTEGCIGMSCPVDGGFSEWSNWTTCSATCGTGFQLRTRSCTNPLPEHGGRSCEGKSAEGRKCKLRDCQVDNVNASSRKSDDEKDSNKYFIPMLVLAVGFALFIFITVGVCCLMNK